MTSELASKSAIWRIAGLFGKSPYSDVGPHSNPKLAIHVAGLRGIPDVQGGVERHCQNLYPRIVRAGADVVLYARSGYVLDKESTYEGIRVVPLHTIRTTSLEAIAHTGMSVLAAKRAGATLIHLHGIGPALWTSFASRIGLKVVVTHHGFDYRRQKWGTQAKVALRKGEMNAIRNADAVICISKEIADFVNGRNPKGIVAKIPNGVNRPSSVIPTSNLSKWDLRSGGYFLVTARFVREKGLTDLIRAWKDSGVSEQCKLVVAGGEDHPSSYGKEIAALASECGATLTGIVGGSDLHALYGHARGFVLPSYHEGLPISLLEAMSYGLPLGASNIEANLEVGLEGDCYFKPGDLAAIGVRLRSILAGPQRVDHSSLMREYDWDRIANSTFDVYRRVLASNHFR